MPNTPHLHLKLSPSLRADCQRAAVLNGMYFSTWIRAVLDAAVGERPLPIDFRRAPPRIEQQLDIGSCRYSVRAPRIGAYERAARATHHSLQSWATIMLAIAAGVSELPEQIDRIAYDVQK